VSIFNVTGASIGDLTVLDSNSNSYTKTANSPYTLGDNSISLYYLIAPSNATNSLSVHASLVTAIIYVAVDDFAVSGGNATYDKEAKGTGTGTTINTPSITPTYPNSLLYSTAAISVAGITAPNAGATLGSWTGGAGQSPSSTKYNDVEYILSATGATAVNYSCSSGNWIALVDAFYIPSAAVTNKPHVQMF
jgi:hypothetical protein